MDYQVSLACLGRKVKLDILVEMDQKEALDHQDHREEDHSLTDHQGRLACPDALEIQDLPELTDSLVCRDRLVHLDNKEVLELRGCLVWKDYQVPKEKRETAVFLVLLASQVLLDSMVLLALRVSLEHAVSLDKAFLVYLEKMVGLGSMEHPAEKANKVFQEFEVRLEIR